MSNDVVNCATLCKKPSFLSTSDDSIRNMSDLSSDFECLRVSALRKASRISPKVTCVTLGPDAVHDSDESTLDDSANKENSINILSPKPKTTESPMKDRSRNALTFSIKKIRLENELQRREEVRKAIERRKQQMELLEKALHAEMHLMRELLASKREKAEAAELAQLEAEEERLERQNELRQRHEQQLQAQRLQERKERLKREAEEHRQRVIRETTLEKLRSSFRERHKDYGVVFKACKDKNSVEQMLAPFTSRLHDLELQMDAINERARRGELSSADVNAAELIARQSEEVLHQSKLEIAKIDAAYDQEIARREQELKLAAAAQLAQAKLPETPPNEGSSTATTGSSSVETVIEDLESYPDPANLEVFLNSRITMNRLIGSPEYEEFVQSSSTKKLRFQCLKAINLPINTISVAAGAAHMMDKYQQLRALLDGKSEVNINEHPQGAFFCKNLLAKSIVNQAETLVSSKPEAAFGLAAVTLALMCDYPDFGRLLSAHFYMTCPYLVPVFLPRQAGQSDVDYFLMLGYKCTDGVLEMENKFLERMSGVMTLYAAIIVAECRKGVTAKHPFGLETAWKWLAATLNFEIKKEFSDVTVTLILSMLKVVGHSLWQAYPRQFYKLLMALAQQYYPQLQKHEGVGGGPMGRLRVFLQDSLNQKCIPQPSGRLPPNFW